MLVPQRSCVYSSLAETGAMLKINVTRSDAIRLRLQHSSKSEEGVFCYIGTSTKASMYFS